MALALSQHADVKQAVEEEVTGLGEIDFKTCGKWVGNMVYTGKVIREVKRLHPLGPLAWRVSTEDIKVGETQITAGTRVVLSTMDTHQDPAQYPEPEKFDCARYTKDRAEHAKNAGYCYVPHGTGVIGKVHRCPAETFTAQVMKAFAIVMTTKCSWKAVDGQDFTLDDALTPKDGLHLEVSAK